jgi:hypothetical protein
MRATRCETDDVKGRWLCVGCPGRIVTPSPPGTPRRMSSSLRKGAPSWDLPGVFLGSSRSETLIELRFLNSSFSSSDSSFRAFRAHPLVEIGQAVPCRAIRGNTTSVNSTLPPSHTSSHDSINFVGSTPRSQSARWLYGFGRSHLLGVLSQCASLVRCLTGGAGGFVKRVAHLFTHFLARGSTEMCCLFMSGATLQVEGIANKYRKSVTKTKRHKATEVYQRKR